jgi:malate dehydrogenase (oxaloacetate-decarboxylating)
MTFLERYRHEVPSFNDDIQGAAAAALGGLVAASRATGTRLPEQRVVIAGAGPVGAGVAALLRDALARAGASEEERQRSVVLVDTEGDGPPGASRLEKAVKDVKPTALIGVSGAHGLFVEPVVREMARHVERPAILPPPSPEGDEAHPAALLSWTDGRALAPTRGSLDGAEPPRGGRADNAFIFPGLALGTLVSEASAVTDGMLVAAAEALAGQVGDSDLAAGALFPPIARLREVSARVAEAVVREAVREDLARTPPRDPAEAVAAAMWEPDYPVVEAS